MQLEIEDRGLLIRCGSDPTYGRVVGGMQLVQSENR
jgi:hypothetical protein